MPLRALPFCATTAARLRRPVAASLAGCLVLGSNVTRAADPPAEATVAALPRVEVLGHYDNAVGSSDAASQGSIRRELLTSRPAARTGELLEFVPGLIVTQHSGDGKANQYFLRGFNLDHGTDFATSVDGMPVNMPTHGHGQGYADLNFLIPELVDRIDYRKGPYFAESGDFSLAGSADIQLQRRIDRPFAQLTLGEHRYRRAVLGGTLDLANDRTLTAAIEGAHYDGPWTEPERFKRLNGLLSLASGTAARGWSATLMAYDASWNATDQVPQRAIDDGRIGRFDAIDASDGGSSSRTSVSWQWRDLDEHSGLRASAYVMRYEMALFSNFTYALDRPDTGDQFEQRDGRTVFGGQLAQHWNHRLGGRDARTEVGVQLRHDSIDVGLYNTAARERLATTRDDQVRETSLGVYAETGIVWTPWLRTVTGLRADGMRFKVDAQATPANSGRETDTQLSPKLAVVLGPWAQTEFFVNAGRGFHSNDARGVNDAADPVPGLVAGTGYELGARTEALPGLQSSLALWRLRSDSELVYVGDAGVTEPNAGSRRQGVEWNNRWIPRPWLLFDADLAWTHARFTNGERIPGAVEQAASVAATLRELGPWSGSVQLRYLGPRPLIEDDSQRAASSVLTNLRLGRKLGPSMELTLDVFNVFDREVNDIEYYYASRLPGEAQAVDDRHVHPAEPRHVRLTLLARF